MKRRQFLGQAALGALGGAWLATNANAQTNQSVEAGGVETPLPMPLVRTPLVLMAPRVDGVEAVWAVNRLALGRVEWECEDGRAGVAGSDAFGFVPQSRSVLRVRIDGLAPGRRYRVRSITRAADADEVVTSEWKNFQTLAPQAATTRFVVWNDTHMRDATIQRLNKVTPAADFLIWNGDVCNDWKAEDLVIPAVLHPGQCDITQGRPLHVVWGNHDVRGKFAFEMPGVVATPEGRPYCAFRSGPVAVVCLHTGEDKPDDHPTFGGRVAFDALRAEQAAWLREVIRRPEMASAPYRVVFCHMPLRWTDETPPDYANRGYDEFSARSREAWHETLVAWKTQLIISGHTHETAWLPPTKEFSYGQLVGGGPRLEDATWMLGEGDAEKLRIVMRELSGAVKAEIEFTPVA